MVLYFSFLPQINYRGCWSCDSVSNNEMSCCSASVLCGIQDPLCSVVEPPSPCLLLWYQLIPWPTMGNLQPEVCEWSFVRFSLESSREALLWTETQEWGDLPTSSHALPVWWHWYVTATDKLWTFLISRYGTVLPSLFLYGMQMADCYVVGTRWRNPFRKSSVQMTGTIDLQCGGPEYHTFIVKEACLLRCFLFFPFIFQLAFIFCNYCM